MVNNELTIVVRYIEFGMKINHKHYNKSCNRHFVCVFACVYVVKTQTYGLSEVKCDNFKVGMCTS
jgi:hypothetical protein